ncbi:hypothetical protein QR680_011060 [Steinernema hermaphroditum]|uniref:Uncharacterized protein n=1 Tax=Steinernema hermaphroditum TaxID=289476 RepID=A0AA39IR03_9BILA|nr:hypothetical protein QR680_011060 [Steinernema hermaphroditum]
MLLLAVVFFPLISSAHSECWNDRLVSKSECIPVGDWTEAIKEQCDTIDNLKFEENCAGIEFKAVNFSCCSPMKGCKGVESARWPFLTTATHFPTSQLIGSIRRGDYSGFKIQFTLQETLDKLTGLMTMFASNTRDCGYDKLGDKADSFLSSYHSIMAKLTGENNKRTKVLHEVLMSIIDGKSTCSLEEQLEEFNIDKLIEKHANRSLKAFPELKEKLEDQLIELQISSTPGILRKHLSFLKDDDASRRVIDLYKQLIKKKDFSIITEEESKHPVGVNSTKNETIHVPDSVKGLVKETLKITPMSDAEVPDMIKPKELISPLSLAFKKIVSLFTDRLTEKFSDYADKKKEDRLSRIDPLGPPSLPGPISSLQTVLSMIPGGSEENESIESGLGGPLSSILALSSLGSGGSKERSGFSPLSALRSLLPFMPSGPLAESESPSYGAMLSSLSFAHRPHGSDKESEISSGFSPFSLRRMQELQKLVDESSETEGSGEDGWVDDGERKWKIIDNPEDYGSGDEYITVNEEPDFMPKIVRARPVYKTVPSS